MSTNDATLFTTITNELLTAVLGDVMDTMGLMHQFLPPNIRPLQEDMFLVGRAMTVLEADSFSPKLTTDEESKAFGMMFDALDSLQPNDIYICSGSSPRYALWGELMTIRAKVCGANGAVLDGFMRDTHGVKAQQFPVFSAGSYGQDQGVRGRVIDYRCPIEMSNGVRITNGDIIVGDIDGVVAIPQATTPL